jgi:curli biogenesis system outer membrane secretion channel CsgG
VVPPFESRRSALDSVALENLQDSLINALINTGRFQAPDRNALALLAQEHRFQMSDWSDDRKTRLRGSPDSYGKASPPWATTTGA